MNKGSCLCGDISWQIDGDILMMSNCHCSMCRKIHGAIMVTFSIFPKAAFTIERGEDNLGRFDSSLPVHRYFCKTCGAPLFILADDAPDIVELATGTLDGGAHPGHAEGAESHIFVGSKIPWYEITDGLPQKDEY